MPASTVLGAVVGQINASPGVTALLPGGAYAGEVVQEAPAPPSCVLDDRQDDPLWLTPTGSLGGWRQESHRVRAACYAQAASTVGAKNPADALADAVEAAVDWSNLGLPQTLTVGLPRKARSIARETKRSPAGERVFLVMLSWRVVLSVG